MTIYFKNGETLYIGGVEGEQMMEAIAGSVERLMACDKDSKGFITIYPNDGERTVGARLGLILNLDEVAAVR